MRTTVDTMAAVRHVKAANPSIGAKKMTARVKKEFPQPSNSGAKVGTKQIPGRQSTREAKLATDTAHWQCDFADDKENHAVHNARPTEAPMRPGNAAQPCVAVHETAPANGRRKTSDQLAAQSREVMLRVKEVDAAKLALRSNNGGRDQPVSNIMEDLGCDGTVATELALHQSQPGDAYGCKPCGGAENTGEHGGGTAEAELDVFKAALQGKLVEMTLDSAVEALNNEEYEISFDLFTRVLLYPRPQVGLHDANFRRKAQSGLARARAGMIFQQTQSPNTDADQERDAHCNVSPPVDNPGSPTQSHTSLAPYQIDIDDSSSSSSVCRNRALFTEPLFREPLSVAAAAKPKPLGQAAVWKANIAIRKRGLGDDEGVTCITNPPDEIQLMESCEHAWQSLYSSLLHTRTWLSPDGQSVVLRHYPTVCEVSLDGGKTFTDHTTLRWDHFLNPCSEVVLPTNTGAFPYNP